MFSVDDLIAAASGKLLGARCSAGVHSFSIDSRQCSSNSCFIALGGVRTHGGKFIADAYKNGASAVIVEEDWIRGAQGNCPAEDKFSKFQNIILVKDAKAALQKLATRHRERYSPLAISITGTAGKTSTKELISQIFSCERKVLASPSSYNNNLGVPLTILKLEESHEVYVQELGASEKGSIGALASLARPDVGVLTNIGIAHLEGFGTPEAIYRAKLELAEDLASRGGTLVYCGTDENLRKYLKPMPLRKIPFASDDSPWGMRKTERSGKIWQVELNNGESYRIPTQAKFQITNAIAAITTARISGISYETCRNALESAAWPAGRFNVTEIGEDILLIDDTYNANPTAFSASLEAMMQIQATRRIVVCGDMLELGERSSHYHELLGKELNERFKISALITVGTASESVLRSSRKRRPDLAAWHFKVNAEAAQFLKEFIRAGDAVLLKGSRGMHLEEIVKELKECFTPSPTS